MGYNHLKVTFRASLAFVIHILRVGLEGDFSGTSRAANVETENGDLVVFLVSCFFTGCNEVSSARICRDYGLDGFPSCQCVKSSISW